MRLAPTPEAHDSWLPGFVWDHFPHFGGLKIRFVPTRDATVRGHPASCEHIFCILAAWKMRFLPSCEIHGPLDRVKKACGAPPCLFSCDVTSGCQRVKGSTTVPNRHAYYSPWKSQEKGGTCATRHCTHLDAAPRQRPMSHGSTHQWIFGRKKPPSLPDLSPCDLFSFLRLKNHLKMAQNWYFEERNRRAERYSSRWLPPLLRAMETTTSSLCSCPRELVWRG